MSIKIISEQTASKCGVPDQPSMELPSCKETNQLGTQTLDLDDIEKHYDNELELAIEEATAICEQLETDREKDRYDKLQPPRPDIDDNFVGAAIEQLGCIQGKTDLWFHNDVMTLLLRGRSRVGFRLNGLIFS